MPEAPPPEQPLYVLPQEKKRIIIPKVIIFLFLGIIFYLGILVNISLLDLSASTETIIKLISLITLIIVVALGIFMNIRKANQKYYFYSNRIAFKKKQLFLREIPSISKKQNFLDKIFKTYSLNLNNKFTIENISQQIQLQDYLQKLINYSKGLSY